MSDLYKLRFPIGEYTPNPNASIELINEWKETIAKFPAQIRDAIAGLTEEQLKWPYRPD